MNPRWEALVKYDEEIRAAADQLRSYGEGWIARFGEAFFALNEDRTYIPNIVSDLTKEANELLTRDWNLRSRRTAEGEYTSKESLSILRELQRSGYSVRIESNGAFAVSHASSATTFFYSNSEIERLGAFLLEQGRKG